MDFSSQGEVDAPRATLTRYLQGFLVIRCIWTRYLRGVMALKGVSPARERRDPPPIPFFIGRNGPRDFDLKPPSRGMGKLHFRPKAL